ncbi:efflux RND transporter permease subunit, partial [bacterium]|nr:efflux RND transporter permease subunit [bacterium]
RIFVGFNVRGRDVESVVEEIQIKLNRELKLPPGYYITYGGQFQNLIEAKERLMIAVPAALLLIFILLFFAFKSVKQSLLIYTAIPLSAIGGVFALWLRDMPFSISAGVGFIALFGVAVLNGIVLISYFNQLEKEGIMDITERVMKGTRVRLRPVIMTAAVASLGFLPMAISTSAGGEVQKPLATVVIGGLISATLLTLIVLPVLYILFSKKQTKPESGNMIVPIVVGFFLLICSNSLNAQEDTNGPLTLDDAVRIALQSNPKLSSASYAVKQRQALRKTSWDFGKTEFFNEVEERKSSEKGNVKIGIRQNFEFPTNYLFKGNVLKNELILSEKSYAITRAEIIRDVKTAYFQLLTSLEQMRLLRFQDSLYSHFVKAAELRYRTGESSFLEKLSAESKYQEIQIMKKQGEATVRTAEVELQQLLNVQTAIVLAEQQLKPLTSPVFGDTTANSPLTAYFSQRIRAAKSQLTLEKSKFLPDVSIGYSMQKLGSRSGFYGYAIGVGIPLWFVPQIGQQQAAKMQVKIAESDFEKNKNIIRSEYLKLKTDLEKNYSLRSYYESKALAQADEILKVAEKSYQSGDIGYLEYIQSLSQAVGIKAQYLDVINGYNQTIIYINYLEGRE